MKVAFPTIFLFLFFLSMQKYASCEKLDLLGKFYFKDTLGKNRDITPSEKMLYPLIQDLAEEDNNYAPAGEPYDEHTFPNPFVNPEECVLSLGISHTWLCDPSHLLSLSEQLEVEAILLKIRDTNFHNCANKGIYYYQVSVALVPEISISKNTLNEKSVEYFSQKLLRKWGIGNKECHDGILLVYVKQLGRFVVAKREGVEEKYINEKEITEQFMFTYFATGSVGKGLIEALMLINKKLPSKPQELTKTGKMFLFLIFLYVVSVIIIYIATVTYAKV
ncbi:conserved Plasmodium protein, unknown function [Plasmodium gonderi]|uniref:MOLO1 domain-containing protein n=1 Tax=Plasmodium gonderi TaxID=77519 RepID=A0A1Y1JGY6_PLAGO|nr:conserved Plasmodium protein, unknown function [Plasmodium gonderi]GAW81510.1 conserved Plasmodium protein, unknown function [Plasmodium gonderi]